MNVHQPHPDEPRGGTETPESVFRMNRRKWLVAGGVAASGLAGYAWWQNGAGGSEQQLLAKSVDPKLEQSVGSYYPVRLDPAYQYDRPETDWRSAAEYTNFYEFSRFKWCWRYVERFQTHPWRVRIDGLCRRPLELDLDQFYARYQADFVERQYRHRCVERWAMAVPWTGLPLRQVLRDVDPLGEATHVRFVSFDRPSEAPNQGGVSGYPWPYTEGLTIDEAQIDLAILAVGVYGRPLLRQHGAPLRLVVPWKYGYKSIKSIQHIELVNQQPKTFWSTLNPAAYPFESNVDPRVPRPWSQVSETMLGTGARYPTELFNGYARQVAHLYMS